MIALQNVTDAAARLSEQIVPTPFLQSQVLSAIPAPRAEKSASSSRAALSILAYWLPS